MSTLIFVLTACGGSNSRAYISAQPQTNSTPIANAGADQNIITSTVVTLNGSASSDADGDILSYQWSLTTRPDGSSVALNDVNGASPNFTPDIDGSYVSSLIVNDGKDNSTADTVTVVLCCGGGNGESEPEQPFRTDGTLLGYSELKKQGVISDEDFPRDPWDEYVYTPLIIEDPTGGFRMFYTAYKDQNDYGPATAVSDDLVTWTKPNVGIITYAGNTNNNLIVFRDNMLMSSVIWAEGQYVGLFHRDTVPRRALIYTSADGETWNFKQVVFTSLTHGDYIEAKSIQFVNNLYYVYYAQGHFFSDRRTIGYYTGATLDGAFTDQGVIPEFTSTDRTLQYYDIHTWIDAGALWACVPVYNKNTEVLGPLMLYRSLDDGVTWERRNNLVFMGESGDFDANLIAAARPINVGGKWHMMYAASPSRHSVWPRVMDFGWATSTNIDIASNGVAPPSVPTGSYTLDFESLPSDQGWTSVKNFNSTGDTQADNNVFSVDTSRLLQRMVGLGTNSTARYQIYNSVSANTPMSLSLTVKVLAHERFSGYTVGLGLNFYVNDGAFSHRLGFTDSQIYIGEQFYELNTKDFHDYRLEMHPGGGFDLYVDEAIFATGTGTVTGTDSTSGNKIFFGDTAVHENTDAEIMALSFVIGTN